ncbi:hypothetical protein C0J52_02252 [Blattella germanica]|nr:hypothetical protein C0J52_02252 [Blattella germanica]
MVTQTVLKMRKWQKLTLVKQHSSPNSLPLCLKVTDIKHHSFPNSLPLYLKVTDEAYLLETGNIYLETIFEHSSMGREEKHI